MKKVNICLRSLGPFSMKLHPLLDGIRVLRFWFDLP